MIFTIKSFGCKVNTYESEWIKEYLEKKNFIYSADAAECDVIIVNSCTVTSSGDSRSAASLKKFRKINSSAVLVLTGCYAQMNMDNADKIDADVIIGTKDRKYIDSLIYKFIDTHRQQVYSAQHMKNDEFEDMICTGFSDHTRAFIKIQDGCNQFCSYCTIPLARGRCRSKPLDRLKEELSEAAAAGYKEIVFCGINLAFYGIEWNMSLRDAVRAADETPGIERIRLGSLEPERISDEDLEYFSSVRKFCPQFHLSLQSGCDETLKRMNRKYDTAEYFSLVEKIRKRFSYPAITTDVMTGFPGETEDEFCCTADFVKKVGFSKIHIFRYSRRNSTAADRMENQVNEQIKTKRAEILEKIAADSQKAFNKSLVGADFDVLFEKQKEPDYFCGHAPNGVVIKISSKNLKKGLRNSIFCVTIEESNDKFCIGRIKM